MEGCRSSCSPQISVDISYDSLVVGLEPVSLLVNESVPPEIPGFGSHVNLSFAANMDRFWKTMIGVVQPSE